MIHKDGVLERIQNNDPELIALSVYAREISEDFDLVAAENAIAENIHLKELFLYGFNDNATIIRFEPLLNGITKSKSVQNFLYLQDCLLNDSMSKIFSVENLCSISLFNCTVTRQTIHELKAVKNLDEIEVTCGTYQTESIEEEFFKQIIQMNLRRLTFMGCDVIDYDISSLANKLATDTTLEELELDLCRYVTPEGWLPLLRIFSNPCTALTALKLTQNEINDVVITSFAEKLRANSSLKELDFSGCQSVTPVGWFQLFDVLLTSETNVRKLTLELNEINDVVVKSLAESFNGKSSLEELNISESLLHISHDGWKELSGLLSRDDCSLKTLHIGYYSGFFGPDDSDDGEMIIDDEALAILCKGLANNSSLHELYITKKDDSRPTHEWNSVSNLLSNKTSIQATLHSNHTLRTLCYVQLPPEIEALLELNEDMDKHSVARTKIIMNHSAHSLLNEIQYQNRLPSMMAWLCKYSDGLSHAYEIVRSMPEVFAQETTFKSDVINSKKRSIVKA